MIEFDAAVPPRERALVARFLGEGTFLAETLRNVLGAGEAGTLRVRPLAGHAGSNKVLYRVETDKGAFVLKHAPRKGFLWLRPRGTFKWREIERLKSLSGKGVTPRFGAHMVLLGHDVFAEELIEGVTGAEVTEPERIRALARMWLTVSKLLGTCGPFWRVCGSTMAPGNAMFPKDGGPPVVVDVGTARLRTPGRIVGKLVASHGDTRAVLLGIGDALGGAGARRFLRTALRQTKDEALRRALRAASTVGDAAPVDWQERSNERFRREGYAEYYEGRYRSFLKGTLKHRWRCAVLRRAFRDVPAASVVLDIPCGTGRYTGFLLGRGYRVLGADIAPEMIRIAKAKAGGIPGIVGWTAADATRLPLPDKSVDSVLTMRLFHLIPKEVRPLVYRELARVCRGQLVLCFNCNRWALKHVGKRLRGETPDHLMSRKELIAELRSGGLRVERVHTKGAGPFSTLWAVVCRPA